MTKTQLTRLSRAVLAERVLDLEATVDTLNQTLSQPMEPAEAFTSLLVRVRDVAAGVALLVIELGELSYWLGRQARASVRKFRI